MENATWDLQVAMGTSEPRSRHAPTVQSLALGSEPIREKPLGHMGTEQSVTQEIGMF
jgi:hypothetical protein